MAEEVTDNLLNELPNIRRMLQADVQAAYDGDPAAASLEEVVLSYPCMTAIAVHRIAHELYLKEVPLIPRIMSECAHRQTGIDIHPGATIGQNFFIDHGTGVVIGETAVIGDNVRVYQGVTLGGTGKEHGKRHPTIGNNVMISAGAKIIGSFTVGENSKIGAGSVVLSEVPPNSTVVGVPGRVVKRDNIKIPREDMDQIHLPDPVQNEMAGLKKENDCLRDELKKLYDKIEELEKKTGNN
jgi:serine O-acetyltransferase